jgi:hypothetical protein
MDHASKREKFMAGKPLDPVRRLRWFKEARFGMFVHWGLYSLIGRHEWVMNTEHMAINEYEKLAKQRGRRGGGRTAALQSVPGTGTGALPVARPSAER